MPSQLNARVVFEGSEEEKMLVIKVYDEQLYHELVKFFSAIADNSDTADVDPDDRTHVASYRFDFGSYVIYVDLHEHEVSIPS